MDTLSPEERSKRMALIKSKNTRPELAVRRFLHARGYRYRLHGLGLPGKPDLVFPSRRKIIFVHGCFWHRHGNCSLARMPKSRLEFWGAKLEANRLRDLDKVASLERAGWRVLVVWECEVKHLETLGPRMIEFLEELNE
jgi:DNA mismatch endonuclease (patch repair protein)